MNRTVKGAFSRIEGLAGNHFLFSPSPPPSNFFFCSRSNFCTITLLEMLATQANQAAGGGASTGMSACDVKEKQDCSREIKQGKYNTSYKHQLKWQ